MDKKIGFAFLECPPFPRAVMPRPALNCLPTPTYAWRRKGSGLIKAKPECKDSNNFYKTKIEQSKCLN